MVNEVQYVSVDSNINMLPIDSVGPEGCCLSLALKCGEVRLIDNIGETMRGAKRRAEKNVCTGSTSVFAPFFVTCSNLFFSRSFRSDTLARVFSNARNRLNLKIR